MRIASILYTIFLLLALLAASPVYADKGDIRITPRSLTVSDDSVHIDLLIRAKDIRIPSQQALTLIPSLHFGSKRVLLPPVVFSGSRRARFDLREETVTPDRNKALPYHTWVVGRRRNEYTLRYCVSIPYASWMEHAALRLKQVSRDCCTETVLTDDILTADINIPSPCAPLPIGETASEAAAVEIPEPIKEETATQQVSQVMEMTPLQPVIRERRVALTLYMDYPRGGSVIDPLYGRNRIELRRVDSLITPLLGNPEVSITEVRITGYASPDGAYYDNEALAKARSLGFRQHLMKTYGLEDYPFRTAWVAEDWEGLRRLIKGKPYEKGTLFIIDNYGIFEGRERYLMELDHGMPYKEMLRELFPLLRRMEIHIIYNEQMQ